jgi:hypothetical protein
MPRFPVAAPVNTAAQFVKPDHTVVDFRIINCAACTAGALTGRTSGTVVGQVFQAYVNPVVPRPGYEPDLTFTKLGNEARQAQGKGPKFPPPVQAIGQTADQHQLNVAAVAEESSLHAQVKALKRWVHGQRGGTCDQHGSVGQLVPLGAAKVWMATRPDRTEFAVYFTSFAAPTPGHWVYAENRGHTVEFEDYQEFLTLATRPQPARYPSCLGNSAPDALMLVLSFSP